MLELCFADSRIPYFWQVLESILKFFIKLHVLQCLFVSGSNKKRRGWIVSNFAKDFFISYENQILLGVISQYGTPSCTLQKRPSSLLYADQEENISRNSIERRAYFVLSISRMFPILASSNRMMNTFIIVNITPTCKR